MWRRVQRLPLGRCHRQTQGSTWQIFLYSAFFILYLKKIGFGHCFQNLLWDYFDAFTIYDIWYIKFHHCDHPGIGSSPLIWVHVTALVSGGSYWPGPHLGQAWPLISETNHLDGHGWGEGCVIKQSNFLLYFSSTPPSKTLLMTTKKIQRWWWQKPAATLMMIKTQWWS